MQTLRNKIIGVTLASFVLAIFALGMYHPTVSAALFNQSRQTACNALGGANNSCASGAGTVNRVIADIIGILSFIVGAASVIMIIIGGFRYVTSNGDSNQIASAKNTIIYAIVGLVVAVLARAIVTFVFNRI